MNSGAEGSCIGLLVLQTALLHSLRSFLSNKNGEPDKTFLVTVALNALKAVIRISIFSKVPWRFKVVLLGSSCYLDEQSTGSQPVLQQPAEVRGA